MHFIPLDSSVGIGTPSTLNTGQILSPSPSTDMREKSSSSDNLVDLLPQIPRLRPPLTIVTVRRLWGLTSGYIIASAISP